MIVIYFIFDLWGLITNGDPGVAYLSHISGFLAGLAIASVMTLSVFIKSDECEQTLFEVFANRK